MYFFEGQNVEGETAQKDTSITEIIDTSSHHLSNDTFFIALKKQLNSITPLKCKKVNLGASEFVLDSTISEVINQGFTAPYIKNDFVSNLHCDSAFVSMSFSHILERWYFTWRLSCFPIILSMKSGILKIHHLFSINWRRERCIF